MSSMKLFGASYSVYTRIVRLVLHRLDLDHEFVEVDIFAQDGPPAYYRQMHPFGRIPALTHDGLQIYETDAIVQYLTHLQPQTTLLPGDAATRARGIQIMRILDNYGFRTLVWGIYVAERENAEQGGPNADAIDEARNVLRVLESLFSGSYFIAQEICLPDLWALPMFTYLNIAPTGTRLLQEFPVLTTWLATMQDCPSVSATEFPSDAD